VLSVAHARDKDRIVNESQRPRYLTVAEVAQDMRVSTMTVYRLIKSGELGAVRVGKSYRIRVADLDTFLDSRYIESSETGS
jgi:excisionase family DNA binding protein